MGFPVNLRFLTDSQVSSRSESHTEIVRESEAFQRILLRVSKGSGVFAIIPNNSNEFGGFWRIP